MNCKKILTSAALALLGSWSAFATQPYGGCWHPKDTYNWSPETDPDAKFNRAKVPLAERFRESELMKANEYQFYEGQVCNATILFNMCSMCPSQGANNFLGYQPTYWQYMDKLVYWAGSASEGIIIPPPAGSIDAAHAQGVKVLGQIFFPPPAFGGTQTWVRQIMTKEGGHYVYAQKLYEIASYLGFDGWFINEEIGGASTEEWVAWMKEFYAAAAADGKDYMEIQWYDARTMPDTSILGTHPNTSQFIEYGRVGDFSEYAGKIIYEDGTSPSEADIYSKIYAGIQTVNSGLTGYYNSLNQAFTTTGHLGSVDLFCPEEHAWKDCVNSLLGTADDNGTKAYAAIKKVFENERPVWTNTLGDPSRITSPWRGFSGAVLERSVITSLPFVSDMSVGVGKHRFVEGEIKGTQDWYHSGTQSILPTWRWWIENGPSLNVSIDWDNAYNFGSSFRINGSLSGEALLRLYKTMIRVDGPAKVTLVYKGSVSAPSLKLSTASSVTPDATFEAAVTSHNGWNIATYDVSPLAGKTVYMMALGLKGSGAYDMNIGRIAFTEANYVPAQVAVDDPLLKATLNETGGDVRISWSYDWNNDFSHFDIYVTHSDNVRTLVGQTRDEAFFIPELKRINNEASARIEIVAVYKDGSRLDVTNAIGTNTKNSEVIDVLSDIDYNNVTNVVLNKTVVDFSGSTNNKETP